MANEAPNSDLPDPLQNYSVLSLFHRTFRDSTHASNSNDIESVHSFFKSMALRSPNKLLDQAKSIVDGGSELMNSKFPSQIASEDKNEFVVAKSKENPQARRPALGLKRPRFSLKPNSSQPAVSLEPSFDIDQLEDPVEYFLAYQKFENAKKELERQTGGVLMDLNQNIPSTTARHRRPGILGRSVHFKHRHSSMVSNNEETFISSQETIEQEILSPSNTSQQEITDPNVASQEREIPGSITKTEIKVNELLDELLSQNCEDLDGDGALTLLQERLQIKPIVLDKLCLPDLDDIRRNDFKAFGGNLPKPQNSLSDIHNKLKGISSKTPVKHRQEAKSSVHPLASPTPPKSPFASISLLKRHILQSNSSQNPFSALDIDLLPAGNSSPLECIEKQFDQVDRRKELSVSGKLKSLILDENGTALADACSREVVIEDSTGSFNKSVNDNSSRLGVGIDLCSSGSHGDLEDHIGGSNMDEGGNSSMPDIGTDAWTNRVHELDEKVEDMVQEALAFAQPDINLEDSTMEKLSSSWSKLDHSSSATVEHHAKDGPSKAHDIGSEQHIEKIQEPSRIILNEQSKEKTPPRPELNDRSKANTRLRKERKRKELSPSQSLAVAGTMSQSGVKRSTRIKSRPLEYWKGERLIHENESSSAAVEHHAKDVPSKTQDIDLEQHIEKIQEPSRIIMNEQSKEKTPPYPELNDQSKANKHPGKERKRKELSRRQSLAGAGTLWQSGVRRSTRIKSRPLEYWKGERFLYGRIHESLATVIGLKYASPAKDDGKPSMKVKYYVSDEYKELVELAALH